ncbi:hypothetical protein A2316_01285 [Candidatus Falkowbacteria bacterium RIFOXYB2_FULL_38_15]|uniref:Peptidoglycan recognition protein family domain-containing protein n=1 Tax=Candidatus Falkowbacteria bacterium RIFOXYA2_FULL_38_12 TaxID=1797993 RepID=A0A1F5S5H7_9BACT|nr:MAG: hypothetical protein A2257_02685 [Candidatus Falkowbacteria bacterium RIFOXYA2_FULL_38_12]OGF32814.1 MAG: hypothetical protein A2316_01285 [Candidatus Falkowbacteria bacterium RIFOXYB2_FULL_38_15]OGF42148.1 MAG: hypothetical protein A2555_02600 [Candidatus Falkowbacteria bacterium RIFOXYD2_FULL_39_16]
MNKQIKAIVFGLSALLFLGGSVNFVVAGNLKENNAENLTGKIEIAEPKADGSFFVSPDYATDFVFTGVGVEWEGDVARDDVNFYLKILDGEKWSEWIELSTDEQDAPDFFSKNITDVAFVRGHGLKLKMEFVDLNKKIDKATIHYFSGEPKEKMQMSLLGDGTNVIARANWINGELDELKRISVWPNAYGDVKKIIIHHTGSVLKDLTNDGIIGQADYDLAVQGVYNWHAKSLSWGDVGYNFLIDPLGRVFEGKAGGDGIVGGHAIRSSTCNKYRAGAEVETGFNRGTIGISLLGDSDKDILTPAARIALVNLIASKSLEFGLEPAGKSFFVDKEYPNIVGHLDVDCTNCPGSSIYGALDSVRAEAQKKFEELGGLSVSIPKASFVGQSDKTVIIKTGETKTAWVEFKNEGKTAWHNYTENKIYLAPASVKLGLAAIDSFNFALAGDPAALLASGYNLDKPNILPGETGRFTLTLNSPEEKIVDIKKLVLAWGDRAWFPGTDFEITVASTKVDYGAVFDSIVKPNIIFENFNYQLILKYKNIGAKVWAKNEISFGAYNSDYKTSSFKDKTWTRNTSGVHPEEEIINPGEYATFNLPIKTGKIGIYDQVFYLIREITVPGTEIVLAEEKVVGSDLAESFLVESGSQAELVSSNFPEKAKPGSRPSVTIKFKNTGITTWKGGSSTVLKILDKEGKKSKFYDYGDWVTKDVAAWLVEKSVKPGETGTFKMYLRAPKTIGDYEQQIILEQKNQKIYIGRQGSLNVLTKVAK